MLNKPLDEMKRPPALPQGTYYGTISGSPAFDESKNRKTPYARIFFQLTSAGEDIDQNDLDGVELHKRKVHKDFFLTEDAIYRAKEFLESIGVETTGRTLGEAFGDIVGKNVMLTITPRPNQNDPEAPPFPEVGDVRGAD